MGFEVRTCVREYSAPLDARLEKQVPYAEPAKDLLRYA